MLSLSFILLTVAFRSIVIALVSVLLNLLSVGAAYGLLTLIFLDGDGAGLFGFTHTHAIDAWVPLFLFSVLFGLSMDYQVFLMSRIKERYDVSGSTREAVTWGVASTARIITGAALIIVAVFAGFASGSLVQFQQMGFGVAIALLLDATVIRSVVLPATLGLLDSRSWYLPTLARVAAARGDRGRAPSPARERRRRSTSPRRRFSLEPPLARRLRRFRRDALPLDVEGVPQLRDEALEGELGVARAAPLVLRDRPQHGAGARDHALLLALRQRGRSRDVEDRDGARLRLLRVLAAGAARARVLELDLRERQHDRARDANRLDSHGRDSH